MPKFSTQTISQAPAPLSLRVSELAALRPIGFDQIAIERDEIANARALDRARDRIVGSDQVHVRARLDDLALRNRWLPDSPDIEPAGVGNGYLVEHDTVGHAAPAE